jgi:hypothetical protein
MMGLIFRVVVSWLGGHKCPVKTVVYVLVLKRSQVRLLRD